MKAPIHNNQDLPHISKDSFTLCPTCCCCNWCISARACNMLDNCSLIFTLEHIISVCQYFWRNCNSICHCFTFTIYFASWLVCRNKLCFGFRVFSHGHYGFHECHNNVVIFTLMAISMSSSLRSVMYILKTISSLSSSEPLTHPCRHHSMQFTWWWR